MDATALALMAREALLLALALSLPVLATAALVGVVIGLLQAATQLQDPALSQLPRLLSVVAAVTLSGAWIGGQLVRFASRAFAGG